MKTISLILCTFVVSGFAAEVPQSLPIVGESTIVENVAFIKIGAYRGTTNDGTEYQKSYFYPRYLLKAPFFESRAICNSYNFELTTFETKAEMEAVLNLADNDSYLRTLSGVGFFIDSMSLTLKSPTDWYWTKSGQKLSFILPWMPGEPNNHNNGNELCLSFGKVTVSSKSAFNDAPCSSISYTFLCQKIEFLMPPEN